MVDVLHDVKPPVVEVRTREPFEPARDGGEHEGDRHLVAEGEGREADKRRSSPDEAPVHGEEGLRRWKERDAARLLRAAAERGEEALVEFDVSAAFGHLVGVNTAQRLQGRAKDSPALAILGVAIEPPKEGSQVRGELAYEADMLGAEGECIVAIHLATLEAGEQGMVNGWVLADRRA